MKELSDRCTVYSWIQKLSSLIGLIVCSDQLIACQEALKANSIAALKAVLIPLLENYDKRVPSTESCYSNELLAAFTKKGSLIELSLEIKRQYFLSTTHFRFKSLKDSVKECLACGEMTALNEEQLGVYKNSCEQRDLFATLHFAKPSLCETFASTQIGAIHRSVRKINSLAMHSLCPPKEVLFLECSCGGGHRRMVHSLAESLKRHALEKDSFFPVSISEVDVPVQVTRPVDPVYTTLGWGGPYDTTWLYNFLLTKDYCWLIEKLKAMSSTPNEESQSEKQNLIRRAILAFGPDLLNLVYTFDGKDIDSVANQLGIPLLHVETDLDLNDWKEEPISPLFTAAVPSLRDLTMRGSLKLDPTRVREIGLAVGPDIEKYPSSEEVQALRRERQEKYGIAENAQIILVSNGRYALRNKLPDVLAQNYSNTQSPIHVLIVCGTNESYKIALEQEIIPSIRHPKAIKITALGEQTFNEMVLLMRICDRFVGKPGGLTCMDLWKTRSCRQDPGIVFDCTSHRLPWERFNAKVLADQGKAKTLEHCEDIITILSSPLNRGFCPPDDVAAVQSSIVYTELVQELLRKAEGHHAMHERQKSWYRMSKRLYRSFF